MSTDDNAVQTAKGLFPQPQEAASDLDSLQRQWEGRGADVSLSGSGNGPMTLGKIVVPKDQRGQGIGHSIMSDMTAHADLYQRPIGLTPSTHFGGSSVGRLKDFYKKHGFVENKGKHKDFSTREAMIRHPRIEKKFGGSVNPTDAQKEAGNYKKGHVWIQGLDITIENPKGSVRSGVSSTGHRWSCRLPADYGYIRNTISKDGDHLDCYVGPDKSSNLVFVVNQIDEKTGKFDEHKAMCFYKNERDALRDYCAAFSDGKGHARIGSVEPMSMHAFKDWLKSGKTKRPADSRSIVDKALRLVRA